MTAAVYPLQRIGSGLSPVADMGDKQAEKPPERRYVNKPRRV